jgi:hydrogenase maturation protease
MTAHPHALVIGLGNEYRSDDAVGRAVARRLTASAGDEFRIKEESGEGGALMEAWKGAEFVVLVDAVESGALPGTIAGLMRGQREFRASFSLLSPRIRRLEAIVSWHARSSDFR